MNGKAKIEGLTNAWYGFAVVSALVSVLRNGIGVFSITSSAIGMIISFVITFFIGRALIKKSGLTRTILILISGIGTLLSLLGTARLAYASVENFSLTLLLYAVWAGVGVYMHGRSFKVLMDRSVKAYVG
jgi:hypothetical protein